MILATPIRQDAEGRYCLNDLHKAAGGEERHKPSNFMQLQSTKELADAISKGWDSSNKNPIDLSRGRYGGTYVHEDLAIDYAAWISPAFKLEVYRAFKETRRDHETDVGTAIMPAGTSLTTLLEMALDSERKRLELERQIAAERPSVEYAEATMADARTTTLREGTHRG